MERDGADSLRWPSGRMRTVRKFVSSSWWFGAEEEEEQHDVALQVSVPITAAS